MNEQRRALLEEIQRQSLMQTDLQLFLDTHASCPEATHMLKVHVEKRREAVLAYEKIYGPLSGAASCDEKYDWGVAPWPWEEEA